MSALPRRLAWARTDAPGLETCELRLGPDGGDARGVVVAREEGRWFAFRWRVAWDGAGATREAVVEDLESPALLRLSADGNGRWRDAEGERRDLDGCLDVDLGATPFSNALPIRRLDLRPGQMAEILVAWVPLPRLEVRRVRQTYTCLGRGADGATWRYEDEAGSRFEAIRTDAEGFVTTYPGLFERVQP